MSQVLNRVGSSAGTFAQVMELGISGVENITYFPILAAVAGIIVALLRNEVDKTEGIEKYLGTYCDLYL